MNINGINLIGNVTIGFLGVNFYRTISNKISNTTLNQQPYCILEYQGQFYGRLGQQYFVSLPFPYLFKDNKWYFPKITMILTSTNNHKSYFEEVEPLLWQSIKH